MKRYDRKAIILLWEVNRGSIITSGPKNPSLKAWLTSSLSSDTSTSSPPRKVTTKFMMTLPGLQVNNIQNNNSEGHHLTLFTRCLGLLTFKEVKRILKKLFFINALILVGLIKTVFIPTNHIKCSLKKCKYANSLVS